MKKLVLILVVAAAVAYNACSAVKPVSTAIIERSLVLQSI